MNEQQKPAAADFLDRLVGKARSEDGGLRPRLPSFFEPIRHIRMDMAAEADPTRLIEERGDSALRTTRADSVTPVRRAALMAEEQPREAAPAHTGRPPDPVQGPGTNTATSPVALPLVVPRPRGPIELHTAPEDGLAPAPPRLSVAHAVLAEAIADAATTHYGTHATHPHGEATSHQSASSYLTTREPVRVGGGAVANEEEGEARLAGHLSANNGALVPSSEPGLRVVVEPQTTPRRPSGEQAPVKPPGTEATPVINVTIGRVEVRAVSSGPSPQRTEGRGPRLSLDEYLNRRGGSR